MPRLAWMLAIAVSLGACGDDAVEVEGKGRVAASELSDGVTVSVAAGLGEVELPFEEPVPEVVDPEAFEDAMRRAVSLFVASEISGAAADLGAGTLVHGTPAAPGEFSWSLDDDRDLALLSFYNVSPGGLTLSVGQPYRAQLAITRNDYVASLPTISFSIAVTDG